MTDLQAVVREEVRRLAAWGPLPADSAWNDPAADLEAFERDVEAVSVPITSAERVQLLTLLDREAEDSLYGLILTIVSIVESAPNSGWELDLSISERPWFEYLQVRYTNYLHNLAIEQ